MEHIHGEIEIESLPETYKVKAPYIQMVSNQYEGQPSFMGFWIGEGTTRQQLKAFLAAESKAFGEVVVCPDEDIAQVGTSEAIQAHQLWPVLKAYLEVPV